MGHSEYLDDSYVRLEEKGDIAESYKDAIANVSVYEIQSNELREQTREIEKRANDYESENKDLQDKY
ncbi:MAG: hypothetical protein P8Y18_07925 [Candidatus Bathyarchaeota archaeon]